MSKKALVSVWNKSGIVDFCKLLVDRDFEILSTGGTKKTLMEEGISVTSVSDLTGFGSIMDGRVKTLHPKIFGGILADRSNQNHIKDLKSINSGEIDLVVVNLYPFVEEAIKNNLPLDKAIEYIDIGGPSMLRAAAKNHESVIPICDFNDYDNFINDYDSHNCNIPNTLRVKYAAKIFNITTAYDSKIASYISSTYNNDELPENINISVQKDVELRYGENPHQKAGFYLSGNKEVGWKQIQGKQLSYNNYMDIESALSIVRDFNQPSCSIIKHANPCGFAVGENNIDSFNLAVSCDPVSYFGGIVGFNKIVEPDLANLLIEPFLECIVAPEYHKDSLKIFKQKKNLRIIKIDDKYSPDQYSIKNALGGYIMQEKDFTEIDIDSCEIPTKERPSDNQLRAMLLGWKLVKYVKSNAILFANENQLLGIGAGQMSRVDSVKIAIRKVQESGLSLDGAIMASDAFFPFPDSLEIAAKAGISSVIQPGGSIKDNEVISKADELGLSMVLTKIRHFYH